MWILPRSLRTSRPRPARTRWRRIRSATSSTCPKTRPAARPTAASPYSRVVTPRPPTSTTTTVTTTDARPFLASIASPGVLRAPGLSRPDTLATLLSGEGPDGAESKAGRTLHMRTQRLLRRGAPLALLALPLVLSVPLVHAADQTFRAAALFAQGTPIATADDVWDDSAL